jgi:Zn-dependent M32 family carboxypeptidase
MMWDREVNMPRAGAAERIAQLTTLSSLIHRMATSDEMGELIESAAAELDGADYNGNEASLIRLLRRNYDDARPKTISRSSVRGWNRSSSCARKWPNSTATRTKSTTRCWTSTRRP